ncbi:MAG: M28 family peptidase, partial [Candidatus Bathyarchaeia archaeon]
MEDLKEIEKYVVGDIWVSDEAGRNLEALCEMGSRFGGTPSEKEAADYIQRKFREYGLENVHAVEFDYTGWVRGEARLEVVEPRQVEMSALSLVYSPPTPPEGVDGEIINLGEGSIETFEERAEEIEGKIVLCFETGGRPPTGMKRTMHRKEKFNRSADLGAVAFIFGNPVPGLLATTGSCCQNRAADIPGVGICKEDAETLLRLLDEGSVRARVFTTDQIKPMTSWIPSGDIPGSEKPDEVVIVGAHFDGHSISQGAVDDCSGAVTVMNVARVLAEHGGRFRRTIRFLCFPLEESGLIGSVAYTKTHEKNMENVTLMVNLDSAGSGRPGSWRVSGHGELIPYLKRVAKETGYSMKPFEHLSGYSDHFPFFLMGAPSISLGRPLDQPPRVGRGLSHTKADTIDKVNTK